MKYEGRRRYAAFFGELLWEKEQAYLRDFAPQALVPVPLHPGRLRKRGYNQALLLAETLSLRSGIPVTDCLIRRRSTEAQKNLGALLRSRNIAGAFALKKGSVLPERILLIDDIYTTGSTVEACAAVLWAARPEAEIRFLTVALTPPPAALPEEKRPCEKNIHQV